MSPKENIRWTIISDDEDYENNDLNIGNIKADNEKAVSFCSEKCDDYVIKLNGSVSKINLK